MSLYFFSKTTKCPFNQHLSSSSSLFLSLYTVSLPHPPLRLFWNPLQAIFPVALCPFFFPRHSLSPSIPFFVLFLRPHLSLTLWSQEKRKARVWIAALPPSVRSFSPDMIGVIQSGQTGSLCSLPVFPPPALALSRSHSHPWKIWICRLLLLLSQKLVFPCS